MTTKWVRFARPWATAVMILVGAGAAQSETVLRAVMHSDLKTLDPIWTPAYITRASEICLWSALALASMLLWVCRATARSSG